MERENQNLKPGDGWTSFTLALEVVQKLPGLVASHDEERYTSGGSLVFAEMLASVTSPALLTQ